MKTGLPGGRTGPSAPTVQKGKSTRIRRKSTIKRVLSAGRCGHRPLRCEIETQYNNVRPPPRGGIPVWAVGWVDVGIDPYDVEYKFHECARRLRNRTISRAGNIAARPIFDVRDSMIQTVYQISFVGADDSVRPSKTGDFPRINRPWGKSKFPFAVSGRQLCFVRFYTSSNASKMRNAVGRAMSCRKRAGSTHVNRGAASAHSM